MSKSFYTPEHKAEIRKVMIDHLKGKGYPNMTSKQILAELKPMWMKLGALKMLDPSWKYDEFVEIAHAEEHLANLKEALREELQAHIDKMRGR